MYIVFQREFAPTFCLCFFPASRILRMSSVVSMSISYILFSTFEQKSMIMRLSLISFVFQCCFPLNMSQCIKFAVYDDVKSLNSNKKNNNLPWKYNGRGSSIVKELLKAVMIYLMHNQVNFYNTLLKAYFFNKESWLFIGMKY